MAYRSTPSFRPTPRPYLWSVRVVSFMLFGQAAFLAGSIIYFVRSIDWAREATVPALAEIMLDHGGSSGTSLAWELQLMGAAQAKK